MKSIMQTEKECYACGSKARLQCHHCIHGTANRQLSERYGLKVWLCLEHHTGGSGSVHFNKDLDLHIKQEAQKAFEKHHGNREYFRQIFGKSYL